MSAPREGWQSKPVLGQAFRNPFWPEFGVEPLLLSGERGRNRTYNLLIKSQLLCQLSYAPTSGKGTVEGRANLPLMYHIIHF